MLSTSVGSLFPFLFHLPVAKKNRSKMFLASSPAYISENYHQIGPLTHLDPVYDASVGGHP